MSKFKVGDIVKYIGTEKVQGIHSNSCGKVLEVLDRLLLSHPPKNVYAVEFDSVMTHDVLELNDLQLQLFKEALPDKGKEDSYEDPYEIITRNWKKIVDNLEACIDAMIDDGNPQEAIKYAILLEQAVNAWTADDYSFEGKI